METNESILVGELQPSPLRTPQYVKLKAIEVDNMLGGGLRAGTVTELCGESGAGKSQMCLQLVLTCQLGPTHGGLYGNAVYIYTDYHFPTRRLKSIMEGLLMKYSLDQHSMSMDNVLVSLAHSYDMLCSKLDEIENLCITQLETDRHVRLVVIDSITSLFRSQFGNNGSDMSRRTKYFTKISIKLNALAYRYNLVILVTNGVSGEFNGFRINTNNLSLGSTSGVVQPSLGLAWSNCITNRLYLERRGETNSDNGKRKCTIVFSPYLPMEVSAFTIGRQGIE